MPASKPSLPLSLRFRTHWLTRYGLTLIGITAAFLLREGLARLSGGTLPTYVTLYPAVMMVALLGGVGPGLFATVVAAFGVDYFILPPQGSFAILTVSDAVGMAVFTGTGILVSSFAQLSHNVQQKGANSETDVLQSDHRKKPVRRFGQRFLLTVGFVLAMSILAMAGLQSVRQMRAVEEADKWETHTYDVIQKFDRLFSLIKDAETGQRGYLLTGEEKYLEPYKAALTQFEASLVDLKQITKDNAGQLRRLVSIETLIREKVAELKQTIDLRQTKGLPAALQIVGSDEGKVLMDQIRQQIADARNEEDQLLRKRIATKNEGAGKALQTLLAGGVLSVLLLVTIFLFLKHENARRLLAEVEVRRHRDHLKEMVVARTEELSETNEQLKDEIVEHQQAKEALREQREWLRVTLTSIGDAVLVTDIAGRITFLNPIAESLTGWAESQAMGEPVQNVFRIINEQTRLTGDDIVGRVLREGQVVALANHTALLTRDGGEVPIEDSAAPIKDRNGIVSGVVLVFHDVTEKRRAQDAIRESEERLVLALASARMATFDWDIINNRRIWSAGVHGLLGTNPETFTGSADEFFQVVHPEDRNTVQAALIRAVEITGVYKTEYRAVWPDGSVRHIAAGGKVHRDDKGRAARMTAVCWDITESKQAEEARARLAMIVQSSDDAILSKDLNGIITSWNVGAEQLFGYRSEEVIGRSIGLLLPPDRQNEESRILMSVKAGERVDHLETVRLTKGGRSLPVSVTVSPLKDSNGRVIGGSKIIRDVSERKQKEEEVQKLNRTLKALGESSQAMMRATSESEYLDKVCKILTATCGHAMVWVGFAEEDEARTVRPVARAGFEDGYLETLKISWGDNERGRGPTGTAIRTGKPCGCKNMLADPAFGLWREEASKRGYASSLVLPLLDDGKAFGAITIYSRQADPFSESETQLLGELANDVSYCIRSLRGVAQRQRAEEQLRLLSAAVESAANGIAITDRDARILWVNPAFSRLTGYGRDEVVGRNPRILKSGRNPPDFYRQLWSTISKGEPWQGELVNRNKDGSFHDEEMTITPVRVGGGEITHFVAIKQNISERKRAQAALQQTAEEVKRSNRDLEQFAYIASHDLQEPLRAVGGYVKLIQRRFPENIDAKAIEYINGAVEGAERMERLISDLLAFSRVGTRGGDFSSTDLNEVLNAALHNLQSRIESTKATVTRDLLPTLTVDATQLMQIFQNLIGNGIKFCSDRAPEIHVGVQKQPDRWVFSVRDNGIGIEAQYFERIFQIFQRLHTRKQYSGTGIGLAICKKMIERHDGSIWVESVPGQGSTFYFSIPETTIIDKNFHENN